MSYKRLSGMENYGSTNSAHSHLLEISSEVVDLEDEEEEELQFKKPVKVSPVTVFKYCGATVCIIALVTSCEYCYYTVYIVMYLRMLKEQCVDIKAVKVLVNIT